MSADSVNWYYSMWACLMWDYHAWWTWSEETSSTKSIILLKVALFLSRIDSQNHQTMLQNLS